MHRSEYFRQKLDEALATDVDEVEEIENIEAPLAPTKTPSRPAPRPVPSRPAPRPSEPKREPFNPP